MKEKGALRFMRIMDGTIELAQKLDFNVSNKTVEENIKNYINENNCNIVELSRLFMYHYQILEVHGKEKIKEINENNKHLIETFETVLNILSEYYENKKTGKKTDAEIIWYLMDCEA